MAGFIMTLLSNLNLQTVLVGLLVVIIVQKVKQRLKYNLPPGPFALPLIGNYEVVRAQFLHEIFADYKKKYGPVFQVFMGPVRCVVLNDIKVVTEALLKRKSDFANRIQSPSIMMITQGGKDIIFANYTPTWKLNRKIAVNALSAELDDPEFKHLMKLFKEADHLFGNRFIEDMFPILMRLRPTFRYRSMGKCMKEMLGILGQKLQQHRESFNPEHIRDFTDALILARREAEMDENKDLLSMLTDTHLTQTLFEIFFAAINTSRLTIYFALRFMGGLQDIQTKVQEELDREVGGYDIPKDTMVITSLWALHHDPDYWKDVDRFDPTRFLDENGKMTAKPESWLPFSMGRRVCLGETVAKPELHLIFSMILQRFKISLEDGTDPEIKYSGSSSILQPEHYKIVVQER